MKVKCFIFVSSCLLLTACLNLQPVKSPEVSSYVLNAVASPQKLPATSDTLLITVPKTSPGFAGNRMAYIQKPYEIKYFAYSRWVDSPANMLLPLMVQTLQNTGHFRAVVAVPFSGNTDWRLDTEILAFVQDFTTHPSTVHLLIRAQLVDLRKQRIIATQMFDNKEAATGDNPYAGVEAANKAIIQFLNQLSLFLYENH